MIRNNYNYFLNEIQENNKNNLSESEAVDLNLIQQERTGDLLFLAGTILAFIVADISEKAILEPQQEKKDDLGNKAIKTLSIESWLFLIASIIFAKIAVDRLAQLETTPEKKQTPPDTELLYGNKIATIGAVVKVAGFALTALGNQIRYNSTLIK